MNRRLHAPGPELVVMGLAAAVCGLMVALLLSALLGAHSSGGPAILKTVTTPSADLGKLREAATAPPPRAKARHHRIHKAVSHAAPAPAVNAQAQGATGPGQPTYAQGYHPSSGQPVQQLSQPSTPSPAPVHKPAPRPKPKGSSGGSFDDSG